MAGSGTEQGEQSWGASFSTLLYSCTRKIKQDFRYPLFLQNMVQGSYYQPKQCTIYGKSLKHYNGFALLDPPNMGNLMTPVQTPVNGRSRAQPSIYIHLGFCPQKTSFATNSVQLPSDTQKDRLGPFLSRKFVKFFGPFSGNPLPKLLPCAANIKLGQAYHAKFQTFSRIF